VCSAFKDKDSCSGALDPGTGGWEGWIALSGTSQNGSSYGIKQHTDCSWSEYAWGSPGIGAISFKGPGYGVTGERDNPICTPLSTKPNLTASVVTLTPSTGNPPVVPVSSSVTLSATIENRGIGSTGVGFTDLFQINPGVVPSSFAETAARKTYPSAVLAGSASHGASVTYTFPTQGTWYVRACADTTMLGWGTIDESIETDNCSPSWTEIRVGTPNDGETTGSLTIDDTCEIASGQSSCTVNASWSTNNAIDPYVYDRRAGVTRYSTDNGSGTLRLNDVGPTFTFDLRHDNGSVLDTESATAACVSGTDWINGVCTATVVNPGTPEVSITADKPKVSAGRPVTITWEASNFTIGCTISTPIGTTTPQGSTFINRTLTGPVTGIVTGSETVNMYDQSKYRISCDNGAATDEVLVNVIPGVEES
jgi:hypothetical protein